MGFFSPQSPSDPKEFYWIVAGLLLPSSGSLAILAQVIVSTPGTGAGFEQIGSDLILVQSPTLTGAGEGPLPWKYNTSRITQSNAKLAMNLGITYNKEDGYIYIFCHDGTQGLFGTTIVSRIMEKDLISFNWAALLFWTNENAWSTSPNNMKSIIPGPWSEGTVFWHPTLRVWYFLGLNIFSLDIELAYSPSLTESTWSTQTIYTIPAPFSNSSRYYNYAAKAHPEYEQGPNEIVLTYNTNAKGPLQDLFNDMAIYHPHFVRATLK
eukprot:TRINITY_DN12620_c0_g1_i1.p1 TRINITY_DN12620_c0_g1~~TRINITY_DN12620_c0_g1_i1.p1  ORF type:complete len:266 (-),score=31.99 TRINITY_DN12620_c0_g1_i1:78-875(-)